MIDLVNSVFYLKWPYSDSQLSIKLKKGMPRFIALVTIILVHIWAAFLIIWEMLQSRIFLNSVVLLLLLNFVIRFISMNLRSSPFGSSPLFSAASAAAIAYWNHFFSLYQKNKSSESKVKFRQTSICCTRVLQAVKLSYSNKTKVY